MGNISTTKLKADVKPQLDLTLESIFGSDRQGTFNVQAGRDCHADAIWKIHA